MEPRKYNKFNMHDSKSLSFTCADGEIFEVNHHSLFGPGIATSPGDQVYRCLFFGGVPGNMSDEEIKKRKRVTQSLINEHQGTIDRLYVDTVMENHGNPFQRDNRVEDSIDYIIGMANYLSHDLEEGILEEVAKPEIGSRLATGVIVINKLTNTYEWRLIVSEPIIEISTIP